MSDVELDYQYLTDNALRSVVRDVLTIASELGAAPGEHHFYIEFITGAEGVLIPETLIEAYPERMTIVLQHQFKDLSVEDDQFSVTLWFKGEPARLTIPFDKVTNFADPSVQFGLRFNPPPGHDAAPASEDPAQDDEPSSDSAPPAAAASAAHDAAAPEVGADIVSLDAFRKK